MDIVGTILLRAALIFLVLGSLSGLIAGAILILRPHWFMRAGRFANRWISTRHLDSLLESSINIDSSFNRYRHIGGAIALMGSLYILYFFGMRIDEASAIAGLAKIFQVPAVYIDVLFNPTRTIVLAGAAFAVLVSLLLLFFPDQFREFEHGANEWLSLRREMKPLEIPRDNVDEFIFQHTRQVGMMLVLGSVYTLVMFSFWAG